MNVLVKVFMSCKIKYKDNIHVLCCLILNIIVRVNSKIGLILNVLNSDARVRRVTCHPYETSWIVASFEGNNEVSMWDLETSAKRRTLWASRNPPLCHTQVNID